MIDDIGGTFGTGTFGIDGILGVVGKFDILGSVGIGGIEGIEGTDGTAGGEGSEKFGTDGTVGTDGNDVGMFVFKFLYVDVSVNVFLQSSPDTLFKGNFGAVGSGGILGKLGVGKEPNGFCKFNDGGVGKVYIN